jgi:O-antigen chain-terminating methyltransferase
LREAADISLIEVLGGVSPDYAVIAQKAATKENMGLFDSAFNKEFGISLESLASRFDSSLDRRIQAVEKIAKNAEEKAQDLDMRLQHVYQSLSWRITAPLRSIKNFFSKSD